jgi:hypothetical protein
LVNVFATSFHLSISAVTPPATMNPVAGHITQRSTTLNDCSAMMPRAASMGGAITQESSIPSPIDIAIRGPTSIPEPNERRLTSLPMRSAAPPGPNASASGTHISLSRTTASKPEANIPHPEP